MREGREWNRGGHTGNFKGNGNILLKLGGGYTSVHTMVSLQILYIYAIEILL